MEKKTDKKPISVVLRESVWKQYASNTMLTSYCLVCRESMEYGNFHCGHIIAEVEGGETNLDNLRPICGRCNMSMGKKNLFEFMKQLGNADVPKLTVRVEDHHLKDQTINRFFSSRKAPIEWYKALIFCWLNRQSEVFFPLNIRIYLRLCKGNILHYIDSIADAYELTGEKDIAFYRLAEAKI